MAVPSCAREVPSGLRRGVLKNYLTSLLEVEKFLPVCLRMIHVCQYPALSASRRAERFEFGDMITTDACASAVGKSARQGSSLQKG